MAAFQNFRSALHGFNREDVVHYIEYLNNVHNSKVGQLNNEIQSLRQDLEDLRNVEPTPDLTAELEAANCRIAELEAALEEANQHARQLQDRPQTDSELEAYRRAERAERIAQERVNQLYQQANGILADATAHADDTAANITALADSITAQLTQLQAALASGKNAMRDTAAALYAVRPIQE